ncbi:MAG: PAS domain S-box protein [Candidatus Cyclobacteriaceae bacterium M3_2C_046]
MRGFGPPSAYKEFINSIDDVALIINDNFEIVEINKELIYSANLSREKVIGKKCYRFLFDNEKPCEHCQICQSKGNQATSEKYVELFKKYYSIRSIRIDHEFGEKYMMHTLRDISSIKLKETELGNLLAFNKAIINNSTEGIIVYDMDLTHLVWNPAMESLTGLNAERVIGTRADWYFPEFEKNDLIQKIRLALNGKTVIVPPLPIKIFSDKEGWIKINFSPNYSNTQEITGVIATVSNITHLKNFEFALKEKNHELVVAKEEIASQNEELRYMNEELLTTNQELESQYNKLLASENKFKNLFNSSAAGLILFAQNNKIIKANSHACELLGYHSRSLKSKKIQDLIFQEDIESLNRILRKLNRKSKLNDLNLKLVHFNGSVLWVKMGIAKFLIEQELFYVAHFNDLTHQKELEKILIENEGKFRSLYDNAPLAYQSLDENGCILDINPMWLKTLGYQRAEVVGKWFGNFLMEQDVRSFEQNFPKFKSKGTIHDVRFCLRHKNGSSLIVSFEGCIGYTPEGKFKQTYCVFKDISSEIKVNQEVENYRQRLEKAEKIASIGHWSINLNDYTVDASPGAKKIYGLPLHKKSISMGEVQKIPMREYRRNLDHALTNLIKHNLPYSVQFKIKQMNSGKQRDVQSEAEYDPQKNLVFGIIKDVTEINQSTIELQEAKFFMESVINNLQEGVIVYDSDLNYLLWNQKMELITGQKAHEVIGRNALDTFPHLKANRLDQLLKRALKGEILKTPDVLFKDRAEKVFWYYSVYSPYYSVNGKIIGVVAVLSDITERKFIENNLKESNDALLKANQELDNFVYRVSHDLRAPIASSLGLARLSQHEKSMDALSNYAKLQEVSLLRLDKFIRDILDYSRNSRIEIKPVALDLKQLLNDIIENSRNASGIKEARVEYKISGNFPFHTDHMRISIILNNIISNAFKFQNTYESDPFIKINVNLSPDHAQITVSDNGIGIHEVHIKKIFQMFYRGTDKKPGTGIGLYIVKDCLEKLQGKIQVKSKIDEGTEFLIELPNMYQGKKS